MRNDDYKNGVIFYNLDNKQLYFSDNYKKYFNELEPLILDIKNVISQSSKKDLILGTLRYKAIYIDEINLLLDKYKYIYEINTHNKLYFTFLYYLYWLSRISLKYFETYFGNKIFVNSLIDKTMFICKRCTDCNELIYEELIGRSDVNDILDKGIYNKYYFDNNPYICTNCQNRINTEKINREQKKADKIILELKNLPYKDYLETDHWKQLRKRKLKQSSYKCQLCASKEDLNVHHNTYENRGCENDEDLVVLCGDCHEKFHGIIKANTNEITETHVISDNTSKTYKIKMFECDTNSISFWEPKINEFISNNITELIDIKTNLFDYTYTMLLIYKG